MKHNTHVGDEVMISNLCKNGRLGEKVSGGPDLTDNDIRKARVEAVKSGEAKI